jgi:hypothetical protein
MHHRRGRRFRLLGSNRVSPVRRPGAFTCRRWAADLARAKQSVGRSSAVMRSSTAVRPRPSEERAARTANTQVRGVTPRAAQTKPGPHPRTDASDWAGTWKRSDQRFRWSQAISWAWLDLNQRPHPYQQSRAYRYADPRFPRSLATVGGEVMRSKQRPSSWRVLAAAELLAARGYLFSAQVRSGFGGGRAIDAGLDAPGPTTIPMARPAPGANARM